MQSCLVPHSCSGGVCSARAETAGSRFSAQQQGSSALHEGGEELRPGRGAVQEGPGARTNHRDKVRGTHITGRSHKSQWTSKHIAKPCISESTKRKMAACLKGYF